MDVSRRGRWAYVSKIMWAELHRNVLRWERRAALAALKPSSAAGGSDRFVVSTIVQGEELLVCLKMLPPIDDKMLAVVEETRLGVARRLTVLRDITASTVEK